MSGRCLAVALAATLLAIPASAQSLIVDEAAIGLRAKLPRSPLALHGAMEGLDSWLPCEVVLSNPGKEELSGSLQLHEDRLGIRKPIRYERQVTLSPGAHKRLSFPVLYDPMTSYRLEFHDERLGELELTRGREAAQLSLPQMRATSERLVLFARRPGDGRRLGGFQPPPQGENLLHDWLVAEIDPAHLPANGLGYHRVDVVILDDISLDQLSLEQQRALLEYVARGGVLWVSMLTRKPGAQSATLQAALPGKPLAVRELREVPSLESLSDAPLVLQRARSFLTFEPRDEATAWDDQRVVVHRRHDQGWIVLAGFRLSDPPLIDGQILLRQLLRVRERGAVQPPSAYSTRLRLALTRSLRGTTRKAVPALGVVVSLLGAYLLLVVALPFAALRRSGRFEVAWVFVAVVALGGVAAVDLLGRSYEQPSSAVRIGLVGGGAAGGAHRRTNYWAVFSEKGGSLPVQLSNAMAAPFPMPGSTAPLRWARDVGVDLETHPQDTTLFVSTEPCELSGGLRFSLQGAAARLRNSPGGVRLYGAWAWNALGKELPLDAPLLLTDPAEGLFADALEILKSHAQDIAQRERRPVLLYRYDGGGPAQSGLPETALDVGILLLDKPPPAKRFEQNCERRLVSEATRDNQWLSTWSFSLLLPEGFSAQELTIELRRSYMRSWTRNRAGNRLNPRAAIYDWSRRSWQSLNKLRLPARGLFATSPLGVARGRLTIECEDEIVPEVRLLLETPRR